MSFTSDDMDRLQSYIQQDPEASALFQELLSAHSFELHKICHEIRNPLTLISGTLQLIESRHPETKSFSYWNSLHEDIEYIQNLLDELSSFNNSSSLSLEPLPLRPFMEKLVLSFASSTVDTDVEFTSRISSLPVIEADAVKLRQAILNLLKNARESISGKGSVFLSVSAGTDSVSIEIQDTGCGMDADTVRKIFSPFVTFKSGGTGLGLPIVQNIVQAHHGTLTVDSAPGTGSLFRVTLPIHQKR